MTRATVWSLFGAILVTGILVTVIAAPISFPLRLLGSAGWAGRSDVRLGRLLGMVSAFVGSWIVILVAVAYDLLVRAPGLRTSAPPHRTCPAGGCSSARSRASCLRSVRASASGPPPGP